MGIMQRLFGKDKSTQILKVIIKTDKDNNFSVEFTELNPQIIPLEYARMILSFYTKVLYVNFDESQYESPFLCQLLFDGIEKLTKAKLNKETDILELMEIDDIVKIKMPSYEHYTYTATLSAIQRVARHLHTEIPTNYYIQQMIYCVPVLIQESLKKLNPEEIKFLQLSLKFINSWYSNGTSFADLNASLGLPNAAFQEILLSESIDQSKFT